MSQTIRPVCSFPLLLFLCLCSLGRSGLAQDRSPLKVKIFSSVTPGVKPHHAIAFTKPMVDLLADQVGYPMEIGIEERAGLMEFGGQLAKGEIHIGVVWGLEYGWLQKRDPQLEMMAVTTQGGKAEMPVHLMVRQDFSGAKFSELKGKRLATFQRAPTMTEKYRTKLIEDQGEMPGDFFAEIITYETPQLAIRSLDAGKTDVIEIDSMTWNRYLFAQARGKNVELKRFATSDAFPEVVIIGRPDRVNALQSDLWEGLQKKLFSVHQTPKGRQCADFWGIDTYEDPQKWNLKALIDRRLRDYRWTEEK